ncbi:hypothetical protein VTP01DRAFT_2018 [Rhizomucor pusillus]|uniref:uncharacterized protein n=1 Tax=Rhizomucor pusillus TaxID=4840 RepID=UPI0037432A27
MNKMPLVTMDMNIRDALKNVHIIPDVIEDENFAPATLIDVEYPSGRKVEMGNRLTPQEASEKPKVSFLLPEDDAAAYTLIMMDPDAPSTTDRQFGPWRHWVCVNIKGADQRGVDHTPYRAPGPRPGSGEHRYIFLLFKQTRGDTAQSFPPMAHDTVPSRRNFDVKQFVRDSDLELVGINFFLCSAAQ